VKNPSVAMKKPQGQWFQKKDLWNQFKNKVSAISFIDSIITTNYIDLRSGFAN
jgi:hypothetical protein